MFGEHQPLHFSFKPHASASFFFFLSIFWCWYFYTYAGLTLLVGVFLQSALATSSTTAHRFKINTHYTCSYLTFLSSSSNSIHPHKASNYVHQAAAPTHYYSSHSRADIHSSRWFSIFAPLWMRCWCPQLSGRTWGPLWWPRPPPGTWAVWAEGWCPKAFWGSRRATCASRWEERTNVGGVRRQSETDLQRIRGTL